MEISPIKAPTSTSLFNQLHSSAMTKRSLTTAASFLFSQSSSSISESFSSFSSSLFQTNEKSVNSITRNFTTTPSGFSSKSKDNVGLGGGDYLKDTQKKKKIKVPESLLHQFRRRTGLYVTDFTSWDWCGKQAEFILRFGKPKLTDAMIAGIARHRELKEEVSKKLKRPPRLPEDIWAEKFLKFIVCANQLSLEGLTREVPVLGIFENVWVVGVIDEIRMPVMETTQNPSLVDTKTRKSATLPYESQKRNGRLQLMCYKYLWDNLVTDNFPTDIFFHDFGLNPGYILSQKTQEYAVNSGFPAKTLGELVRLYRSTCCTLPSVHDQLLLRYELQIDHSLLGEDRFTYDSDWLKSQMKGCVQFWLGEKEASYVSEEERVKCRSCDFAPTCPSFNTNTNRESTSPS